MYQKATDTLRVLLLTGIFFMMGLFVFAFYDNQEKSIFDLQQEYTQNIQKQLNNLLEPLVGAGNVKTSAQVRLQQTDQTTVSKKWDSPTQQTTTTIRYQGPSLKSQHISVLLNKTKNIQENDISELGYRNSSATMMPAGTVLFSSRAPIGYIAIASNEVTTNQGFKSVVPHHEIGTPFVYYFLIHNLPLIESKASGSTFKEVSGSVMKSVEAVIPDSATLAKFNDFCRPIFEMQAKLEQESKTLVVLRDSLLPRLMRGEIDITDINV